MAKKTARSLRERKKFSKNRVVVWLLVVLLVLTVFMTALYCNAAGDARVLKKMKIYELSGSSNVLQVQDVLLSYNGKDMQLAGGTFTFTDTAKIKNMSNYSYQVFLQEQNKEEKIPLLSNSSMDATADFTKPMALGSITAPNENIDFKKFTDKYVVGFRLDIATTAGLVSEEIFLKPNELDTDFFRGLEQEDK